jgi:hypothetical protein
MDSCLAHANFGSLHTTLRMLQHLVDYVSCFYSTMFLYKQTKRLFGRDSLCVYDAYFCSDKWIFVLDLKWRLKINVGQFLMKFIAQSHIVRLRHIITGGSEKKSQFFFFDFLNSASIFFHLCTPVKSAWKALQNGIWTAKIRWKNFILDNEK